MNSLKTIPYIDLHCDTVLALWELEQKGHKAGLKENELHIDLQKLKTGGCMAQFFALFTELKADPSPEHRALSLYDKYCRILDECSDDLRPVLTKSDLENNRKDNRISAILSLEEGDVVFRDLAMLRNWQRMGVRMIALTWNYPNSIGYPNISMDDLSDYKKPIPVFHVEEEKGLTEFGKEYVRECERLGILVDVSHLGDKAFWDVIEIARKPVIASHSNSRKICRFPRNLTDEMIKAIADTGGVIGLNFCADFLNLEAEDHMRLDDLLIHIDHIKEVGGIDCLGLGSDFDGIHSELEIKDASGMQKIAEALNKAGYSEEEIEKIFCKNVLRVLEQVLPE